MSSMIGATVRTRMVLVPMVAVLFAIGCDSGADANGAGRPDVDRAEEIQLTWDGADCFHEGTIELAAGPITLTFVNASDQYAFVYMAGKAGDDDQFLDSEEAQELMEHLFAQVAAPALTGSGDPLVDQRSAPSVPTWAIELPGSTHVSEPRETFVWDGELEPAHYHTFCGRARPHLDYQGFTLTVTG